MSYEVVITDIFQRSAKPLAKKHRSLKKDLLKLTESLEEEPEQGIQIRKNFYKIKMAITSKGKGKSGGARVFTFVAIIQETVFLVEIIDKSDRENISEKEIDNLIQRITKDYVETGDEEE